MIEMNSATRLRQWRKAKNLSVEQLADDIGKKPVTIRAYEGGRNVLPSVSDLVIWSEKYGLDIHWLATGVGDMDYADRNLLKQEHQELKEQIEDLKNRLDFWVRAFEEASQSSEQKMEELVAKYDFAMRVLSGDEHKSPVQIYKPKVDKSRVHDSEKGESK